MSDLPEQVGSLARRWSTAIAVSYLGFGVALLSNVAVARALGPAGRGEFSLFQATVFTLAVFAGLGLGHGQMFHAAKHPGDLRHFMPNAITIAFALGGPVAVFYFSGIAPAYRGEPLSLGSGATAAAIVSVPLLMVLSFQRQYLLVRQNVVLSKLSLAVSQAVPLLSLIVLAAAGSVNLQEMVIAFAIGQCLCVAVFGAATSRMIVADWGLSLSYARRALSFGIRQYMSDVALILVNRLDFFVVGFMLGTAQLGVYAVAVGLAEVVMRLSSEMGTMLFPTFSAQLFSRDRTLALFRQTLVAALILGGLLAMIATPLTEFLFGSAYEGAGNTLRALLVGTVAWSTIYVTWNFVSANGRPILGLPIFGLAALLDLGLNLILLPRMGTLGAGIASSISYWVAALIFLAVFCRMIGCAFPRDLVPRRQDLYGLFKLAGALVRSLTPSRFVGRTK